MTLFVVPTQGTIVSAPVEPPTPSPSGATATLATSAMPGALAAGPPTSAAGQSARHRGASCAKAKRSRAHRSKHARRCLRRATRKHRRRRSRESALDAG